jgi:hypothetical protein
MLISRGDKCVEQVSNLLHNRQVRNLLHNRQVRNLLHNRQVRNLPYVFSEEFACSICN